MADLFRNIFQQRARRRAILGLSFLLLTSLVLLFRNTGTSSLNRLSTSISTSPSTSSFSPSSGFQPRNGEAQTEFETKGRGHGREIHLEDPTLEKIVRLRVLKAQLGERFENHNPHPGLIQARRWNAERIDLLIRCLATDSCERNQEKVVVLASHHFGLAHFDDRSGEGIWALALDESIQSLGYTVLYSFGYTEALTIYLAVPDLVTRILMEYSALEDCMKRGEDAEGDLLWTAVDYGGWQAGRVGCIKREGFEEGIPAWLIHTFHGWAGPAHPLGANFTVSLEPFRELGLGSNYYIGYSIEKRCRAIPTAEHRRHQAIVLGKQAEYFEEDLNMFFGMLKTAGDKVPPASGVGGEVGFDIVAVAGEGQELAEAGLVNKGAMKQEAWYAEVAQSKLMIGIGSPPQSPSPYDAMCLGLPFINPILDWDRAHPEDKAKWVLQQPALIDIEPPYVYTVRKGDRAGLEAAILSAVKTPIDRYIPPRMTIEAMRDRMRIFLDVNWHWQASNLVEDMPEFEYLL